ncbi:RNA exonuclease Ngl2p [[Candida] jaroonii]|uniref:RNA exonuclease Ngl2p n=1 Tax=[Candida] jaroonii TaxID=467808 RepID=A0ACA9Y2L1_9ASCO|nr:RNA exonuclease Ngl2p [[Candida] jaroonii]
MSHLTPKNEKKSKKEKTKKAVDPSKLTPEYIEEQRRLRNLKKEQKRKELLEKGIDESQLDTPEILRFNTRPFISVSNVETTQGKVSLKIMTYNVLAQALIRRKLFPTSGNALKWATRSQVLLNEMKHYDADIMCLQELDFIQYKSYWKSELLKLGYESNYFRNPVKNHGVCIFYKQSKLIFKHQSFIDYDREESGDIPARTITQNIGLLACFDFHPKFIEDAQISRNGLIIGTTHLFWHPFGTYERTRQTYLILKKTKDFLNTMNSLSGNDLGWYTIFAGDFNSQPFDSPYLSIVSKPVDYTDRAKNVIGCSLSYQYSRNRGMNSKPDNSETNEENEDEEEQEEEEGGNVEKFGSNQPQHPVPETFDPTPEQSELIAKMQDLHNNLPVRAVSLYSLAYDKVDGENAGKDNARNEPMYSNWAHAWRGLLDYIMVITNWDASSNATKLDTIEEVANRDDIRLLKLLRLPRGEEMGEEPSGQPRIGQYPSDHFCLMAEIELL